MIFSRIAMHHHGGKAGKEFGSTFQSPVLPSYSICFINKEKLLNERQLTLIQFQLLPAKR